MSTRSTERRPEGRVVRLFLGLVLLAAGLTACSPFDDEQQSVSPPTATGPAVPDLSAVLRRRTEAVRTGDLTEFLDVVDPERPRFVARQRRYFLNLRELPLGSYGYHLDEATTTLPDGRVQAVVTLRMQLRGYDAVPVQTPGLYTFRQDDNGAWLLSEDRDRAFEIDNDIEPQPWDMTRIEVAQGDGVLGVFDAGSVDAAYQIMGAVEDGITEVSSEVPLRWSQRVVVYALSDLRFLSALDDLPGGDPNRLDGVAFPVRAAASSPRLAGIRFLLHPRMIDRDDATRNRLIRHELTHVALGRRDDQVPTWLAEGLAEYVSVQPIPVSERLISRDALAAAQAGLTQLPADTDFNGPHSGANYGIAWYACEVVASSFGEETLWRLLDEMRADGGTTDEEQDAELEEVLGMDSGQLAREAGRRIVDTFG